MMALPPLINLRDISTVMTAKELMSLPIPEVEWLIPNPLPAGLALLGWKPKIGINVITLLNLLRKILRLVVKNGDH